jgi:hypothetical protein
MPIATAFDPQPGDRCNWRLYTDVLPCTILRRTATTVIVRIDIAVMTKPPVMVPGGFAAVVTEPAEYQIEEDPTGRIAKFSLRKSGAWKLADHGTASPGNDLRPGWWYHHDYGF